MSDEQREALIDWEHGNFPGCPLPFSPALGQLAPENVLLWTLHQQAKALTWDTVWQLTALTLTTREAETMRGLLAYLSAYEQSLLHPPQGEERR